MTTWLLKLKIKKSLQLGHFGAVAYYGHPFLDFPFDDDAVFHVGIALGEILGARFATKSST
jgi:hypothetical protein